MTLWLMILGAGLITFITRLSFIVLLERLAVPEWFKQALRFVPPAVLMALTFPEVFTTNGALDLGLDNARLLAGVVATLVAWRTKNVFLTIGVGLAVLVVWPLLLNGA